VSQKNEIGFWKPVKNCIFWYVNENNQRCRVWENAQNKCVSLPNFLIKKVLLYTFLKSFLILTRLIIIKTEIPYRGVSTKGSVGRDTPLLPEILKFFFKKFLVFSKNLQFFYVVRGHAPGVPPDSSTSICPWFHIIFVFTSKNWVDYCHEIGI
jgi:hypothetical protein